MPALHPEGKHDPHPRTRTKNGNGMTPSKTIPVSSLQKERLSATSNHLLPAGQQNTKKPDSRRLTVCRAKRQEEEHSVAHLGPGRQKFPKNMVPTVCNSWGLNDIL